MPQDALGMSFFLYFLTFTASLVSILSGMLMLAELEVPG
jgi:hypothetical protein